MERVHVCDMMLQRGVRHVDSGLGRKVERRLADLGACAPSMFRLEFGDIRWSVLAQQDGLVLRLDLVPRRQGWLRDALSGDASPNGHLQDEADMIFADLQDAQIKVTRLAHSMIQGMHDGRAAQRSRQSLGSVISRHSSRKWEATRGSEHVQVVFPEVPLFAVDDDPCSVEGTVVALARGWMRLDLVDHAARTIGQRHLDVRLDATRGQRKKSVTIDAQLVAEVRLHRCLFTRTVVGSTLLALPE